MNRRGFLRGILAAGTAPLLPGCFSPRAYRANGKVRLAAIGVGQQGWYDLCQFFGRSRGLGNCQYERDTGDICELVALCDTDMGSEATRSALRAFSNLPRYRDFREMFDEMEADIDAVLIAIPDFSHFPAAMHAMRLGKAVYVEKPLAHTFEECELLKQAAARYGVVTQMGNQGHSTVKYLQFKEYVEKGIVSGVTRANVHMNMERRWHKYQGNVFSYPVGEEIPSTLDYDTWLATARYHEYSSQYMRGDWRSWYDFGSGSIGDWGAHTLDCMHEFLLKCDLPTRIELKRVEGWNQFVYPTAETVALQFPKNRLHDDFELTWYAGKDNLPPLPKGFTWAVPDSIPRNSANDVRQSGRILYPGKEMYCKDGTVWQSLSHKHPLHRVGDYAARLPDYPAETGSHYRNFIRAVRSEVRTTSPFEIAAPLSQLFCLANVAIRVRRSLNFDPSRGEIIGDEYANALLKGPAPRPGWETYYQL